MPRYLIEYTREDMPEGYIGKALKYGRDEKEAVSFLCKTKPDKSGLFRMKRGGLAKLKSITKQ